MRRPAVLAIPGILLAALCACATRPEGKLPGNRREFAAAFDEVEEGMRADQVAALIGDPHDIRTRNDPGGIPPIASGGIWRYGTSGHLTTATLGQVFLDANDRVSLVFGKGDPPAGDRFDEVDLRRCLAALDAVSSYQTGSRFHPRALITAVNLLHGLGKERALAAVSEYLRVAAEFVDPGRRGTFLVLRALFEVPGDPGYMPRMYVGQPGPPEPEDPTLLPRFPLAIEGDIPLMLVNGYSLAGLAEPPERHVEYFRAHGKLRERPLVPVDDPLEVLEDLRGSLRWIYRGSYWNEQGYDLLLEQVLRLVDTVYRVEPGPSGGLLPWEEEEKYRILNDLAALRLRIHWDPLAGKYVFADGSSLPEEAKEIHRREYWEPALAKGTIELAIERRTRRFVDVDLRASGSDTPGRFRFLAGTGPDRELLGEFFVDPTPRGTLVTGGYIRLPRGASVEPEFTSGSRVERGPVFTP